MELDKITNNAAPTTAEERMRAAMGQSSGLHQPSANPMTMSQQPNVTGPTDAVAPGQVNVSTQQQTNDVHPLAHTEFYQELTQAERDAINAGAHPDKAFNDLDMAIKEAQDEALLEINAAQIINGGEEYTKEEIIAQEFEEKLVTNSGDDVTDSEAELLRMIEGVDEESEEEQEETQLRQMRELEDHLRDGVEVYPEGAGQEFTPNHAPLDVKVSRNTEYEDTLKTVMSDNNLGFKTSKKKGKIKSGLLKSFTQRNPHVTTPLINSGIHITLSGASIPEIISMNTLEASSRTEQEIKRFDFIYRKLIDTSIGSNIKKVDLMKLIHLQDMPTLWYNLYIGTFPDPIEFPITCENPKCGEKMNLRLNAADLVLNYDEFKQTSDHILYKATNVKELLAQSALSKTKDVTLANGLVVSIKSPSFYDNISTTSKIEQLVKSRKVDIREYQNVLGYLIFIQWIAIPDNSLEYTKYDSTQELLDILITLDEDAQDQIDQEIEDFVQKKTIRYGIRNIVCPSCKHVHTERVVPIDEMLFTLSQMRMTLKNLERYRRKEAQKKS